MLTEPHGAHRSRRARAARVRLCAVAVAVAIVGGASACSSSTSAIEALIPIVGTFKLIAVNDAPLPYQDGTSLLVRGALTINANTHYTLTEVDSASGGTTTLNSTGVWNVTSNAVAFHDNGGTLYVGAADETGDTVRVQVNSHLSLYVKQ